jgi:putative peptide zinc metalloprotease protein
VPFTTVAEGVVWLPEQARIRAQSGGFVEEVLAKDGQTVKRGDPLLVLSEPELKAREAALKAEVTVLDVDYNRFLAFDAAHAQLIGQDATAKRAELAEVQRRLGALRVVSPIDGTLVMPRAQDLPGSYVARGKVLAHVLSADDISVKVVVPQVDVGLIRGGTREVQVRLSDQPENALAASLTGEVPAATAILPTAALGDRAGGPVLTDPSDAEGTRTLEPVFLYDVRLQAKPLERVGSRVLVRFDHGASPLAFQWQRRLLQLFLKQFNPQS